MPLWPQAPTSGRVPLEIRRLLLLALRFGRLPLLGVGLPSPFDLRIRPEVESAPGDDFGVRIMQYVAVDGQFRMRERLESGPARPSKSQPAPPPPVVDPPSPERDAAHFGCALHALPEEADCREYGPLRDAVVSSLWLTSRREGRIRCKRRCCYRFVMLRISCWARTHCFPFRQPLVLSSSASLNVERRRALRPRTAARA